MGYSRKMRRQVKRTGVVMTNEQADNTIKAMQSSIQASCVTAEKLLAEAQPKLEADIKAHYQQQIERIRADIERQANEQVEAMRKEAIRQTEEYEDHCRREYDERVKIPKAKLKREVIGDIMAMTMWVLKEKLGFQRDDLHEFLKNLFLLESDMAEPRLALTINDLTKQLKIEGYDMSADVELINELVEAEHDRYIEGLNKPIVPRGSILDRWRKSEEERMKRLLGNGVNFKLISMILGRSEGAIKARAKKLWGTSDMDRLREALAA